MRRIGGGGLVLLACLFVLAAMAGSAGQPHHTRATGGALLLAAPAAGLGAWLVFVPRRRRSGGSRRPRWHVAAAILIGVTGAAAAALTAAGGAPAIAWLLLTVPAGAVLWWTATHHADAPPRPTVVELPGGVREPALLYAIPRSKQATLGAASIVGVVAAGAVTGALRSQGSPLWLLTAAAALASVWAATRWVGPADPEAGLALSRSGVSVRQRGRVVLVPWDALEGAEVVRQLGPRGTRVRLLRLSVSQPDRVRGLTTTSRRVLGGGRRGGGEADLVWAAWLFDTDARRIADHVELLRDEPEMRIEAPAMPIGAQDVP